MKTCLPPHRRLCLHPQVQPQQQKLADPHPLRHCHATIRPLAGSARGTHAPTHTHKSCSVVTFTTTGWCTGATTGPGNVAFSIRIHVKNNIKWSLGFSRVPAGFKVWQRKTRKGCKKVGAKHRWPLNGDASGLFVWLSFIWLSGASVLMCGFG